MVVVTIQQVVGAYLDRLTWELNRIESETHGDGESDYHARCRMEAVELHNTLELQYLARFATGTVDMSEMYP